VAYFNFIWTQEIVAHLADHGISPDDFERVVCHPTRKGLSRSTNLPVAWGYTADDRYIMAVYERLDRATILPVTAYEVPEPR
jgi:hypothetical protein